MKFKDIKTVKMEARRFLIRVDEFYAAVPIASRDEACSFDTPETAQEH